MSSIRSFITSHYETMIHNLPASFIKDHTLLSNLANEQDDIVDKYVMRALVLVFSYVNKTQFYQEESDSFLFPDEFMLAVMYVVEIIYVDHGMFTGKNALQSESIGDYSYSKKQETKALPLDLPANIIAMLDPYKTWAGNLGIDV
jgi:hypothetical protein